MGKRTTTQGRPSKKVKRDAKNEEVKRDAKNEEVKRDAKNEEDKRDAKNEEEKDDSILFLGESRPTPAAAPAPVSPAKLTMTREGKPIT